CGMGRRGAGARQAAGAARRRRSRDPRAHLCGARRHAARERAPQRRHRPRRRAPHRARRHPDDARGSRRRDRSLMDLLLLTLALMMTLAAFAFYSGVRDLPPNLRSAWLPVHVTAAFLGNAVLALAFCVSLVYLFRERQLKEKRIGGLSSRLPSLEALDTLNYRALVWGFP